MDINEILQMLDWNNDEKVQHDGRINARKIKCLNVFMLPKDKQFNKNIWTNCALILSEKEDELLSPYLSELLNWLQDMNWPGAITIFERLRNYRKYDLLSKAVGENIIIAKALKDEIWISNIVELITCEELKKYINVKEYKIIERIIE